MSHMMVCGFSIIMRTHAMCAKNNEIKKYCCVVPA